MRTAGVPRTEVELGERIPRSAADYARVKMGELARLAPRTPRHVHIRLVRATSAATSPVLAHVRVDLDGTPLVTHAVGSTASETVDLVQAKLRGQLRRLPHGDARARHTGHYRRYVRRSHTRLSSPSSVGAAIRELDDLGYRFGLFTDAATQRESVVWRAQDGRHRLTCLDPRAEDVPAGVTVDLAPAPVMSEVAALQRLDETRALFVFYREPRTDRGGWCSGGPTAVTDCSAPDGQM
ncbi:hypothetical protein GCM10029964_056340 [Kibdelosporangium lantanae]